MKRIVVTSWLGLALATAYLAGVLAMGAGMVWWSIDDMARNVPLGLITLGACVALEVFFVWFGAALLSETVEWENR